MAGGLLARHAGRGGPLGHPTRAAHDPGHARHPRRPPAAAPVGDRGRRGAPPRRSTGSRTARCSAATVVVTRARAQASALSRPAARRGAEVVEVPDHRDRRSRRRRRRPAAALAAVQRRTTGWCSPRPTARRASSPTCPTPATLGRRAVAAIGPGTAAAPCRHHRSWPTSCPSAFVAESLLEAFPAPPPDGGRVLLARAAVARDVLPDGLRAAGWEVDVVAPPTAPCRRRSTIVRATHRRRRRRHLHVVVDGHQLRRRGRGRCRCRRSWQPSARSPPRPAAASHGGLEPCWARPDRARPSTAWSTPVAGAT